MNSPTLAAPSPPLADLSLNWVIRRASPKPVRHCSTQPSWACAGIWLCTKIAERSGSMPIATQLGGGAQRALAEHLGVLLDGDRVQVGDEEERLVVALQVDPLPQRARGSCRSGTSRPSAGCRTAPAGGRRTPPRGRSASGDVVDAGHGRHCVRPGRPAPGRAAIRLPGARVGRCAHARGARMPTPTLTDGMVTCAPTATTTWPASLEQCQDPRQQAWTTVPVPYSLEDARAFVAEVMPGGWADGTRWGFAVEVEGRYAGTVELRDEGERRPSWPSARTPGSRGTGVDGAGRPAPARLGVRRRGLRTVVVWRAQRGQLGVAASWPGGWASPSTARSARRSRHRGELRRRLGRHAARHRRPGAARRWLEVPVLEADGAPAAALARRRRHRGSSRRAATSARSTGSAGCREPYTESDAPRGSSTQRGEPRHRGERRLGRGRRRRDDLALASVSLFDLVPEHECRGRLLGAPRRPRPWGDDPGRRPWSSTMRSRTSACAGSRPARRSTTWRRVT